MNFVKNLFDYFRGGNTKREEENKYFPGQENNDSQNTAEVPRPEMDIELQPGFIDRSSERNKTNNNDMPHLFSEFTDVIEIVGRLQGVLNEMQKFAFGAMEFGNFFGVNYGDMGDSHESEKTLTGERLRNYYLSGNSPDTYQEVSHDLVLDDKKTSDNDFTLHFKRQFRFNIEKGLGGIAEITIISKDESGNEERTVRKVRLF